MSMHTPGPWFGGSTIRDGSYCIVGDGDSVVCEFSNRSGAMMNADARLIAAAPELLAELQNIANAKRFDREAFESDTAFVEWARSRARYAIAKATTSDAIESSLERVGSES